MREVLVDDRDPRKLAVRLRHNLSNSVDMILVRSRHNPTNDERFCRLSKALVNTVTNGAKQLHIRLIFDRRHYEGFDTLDAESLFIRKVYFLERCSGARIAKLFVRSQW